ncbi:MAG: arabinan endo-1,5-alpha-L-arabinosidase [Planctomycetes bacterium]|nr:arabinan endo-1,5-alpha-L-arabinosidase [Planctomycetota bacterium]
MLKVLTDTQASRWKDLQGEPFQGELGGLFGRANRRLVGAHDPSTIVKDKGEYWTFTTGRGILSLRSKDLVHWERGPTVFPDPPPWITGVVPTQRGTFWAPDVIYQDGRYLLYYSVSALGKRTSAIGLASNPTLDPDDPHYHWTDHGIVIQTDERDDYNAIDPSVARAPDGTLWLAFGSYWSGIKLLQLNPRTGKRIATDSPLHAIASHQQIEASALYPHDGYFYLFVNWGSCCRGVWSTYNIRVGRSRDITGPYLDKDGIDLLDGGGSLVLGTEGSFIGPGHAGVLKDGGRYFLSYHFYDGAQFGRSRLGIRPLEWTEDGWPRVTGKPITPPAAQ